MLVKALKALYLLTVAEKTYMEALGRSMPDTGRLRGYIIKLYVHTSRAHEQYYNVLCWCTRVYDVSILTSSIQKFAPSPARVQCSYSRAKLHLHLFETSKQKTHCKPALLSSGGTATLSLSLDDWLTTKEEQL